MRGLAFFVALSRMNGGLILEVATSYSSIHLRKLLFFEEERGQPGENTRNSEQFPGECHIKKGRGVPLPSRPPVINRVVNILVFSGRVIPHFGLLAACPGWMVIGQKERNVIRKTNMRESCSNNSVWRKTIGETMARRRLADLL